MSGTAASQPDWQAIVDNLIVISKNVSVTVGAWWDRGPTNGDIAIVAVVVVFAVRAAMKEIVVSAFVRLATNLEIRLEMLHDRLNNIRRDT